VIGRHTYLSDGRGRIHYIHSPRNSTPATATTEAFPASLADKQNSHHHHHPIPSHPAAHHINVKQHLPP
jgi:hypothetical protein